ncbi:UNVERIFIED_ORG: hypothetical protein J2X95_001104 [Enterobacter mori]|nr:hypothetical protein [Enterobacter mori]MDP9659218.1 hypothetical protein [Enterobacter mori]
MQMDLSPANDDGVRQIRIALDGGTKCRWTLSGIRVGIQLARTSALAKGKDITPANYVFDFDEEVARTSALAKGKDITPANYVFDFDEEGYSNAFGKGKPTPVSGDLFFKTEFFPMEYVYRSIKEMDLDLFAGDERYNKWNRYYKVTNSRVIKIEPIIYLNKVVKLEASGSSRGKVLATYPDGSSENISGRVPDYEKLRRMK